MNIEFRGGGRSKTVLVVDDDPMVLETLSMSIKSFGYNVVQAREGREALTCISVQEVDLLFTDMVMPQGLSGEELAKRVWQDRPELPVVFTTGLGDVALPFADKKTATTSLLKKPYRRVELGRMLHAHLG